MLTELMFYINYEVFRMIDFRNFESLKIDI